MKPLYCVYLAGPDVFLDNGQEVLASKAAKLREFGFVPLTPLDKESSDPAQIYKNNIDLIEMCDAVLADVTPLHGTEPDSGTVFEIGYAKALRKKVITYRNSPFTSYKERIENFLLYLSGEVDPYRPEPFGLAQNLMISKAADAEEVLFEAAVKQLKALLG